MADAPPSLKRPRPDETHDDDLYFEDGSIVLSANDSDGNLVYFRVHKSVLAKQSTVLKDMFSVPSPPQMELYDSIPLVHLHDNAKELKEFLQAMYDPSSLPFRRLQEDTPVLVAGPLKLATKYQADGLRSRIISHLETDWPTTLESWDEIAYAAVTLDPETPNETSSQLSATDDPNFLRKDLCPDPVSFISLARECDLPGIFGIIFYSLCRDSTTRKEKLSCMTKEDLKLLILGREQMMSFICEEGTGQLEIDSWVMDYHEYKDSGRLIYCDKKGCHTPVFKAWLDILQNVLRDGDPLATFRVEARKLKQYVNRHMDDERGNYYDYNDFRDEMCIWCKSRLSEGLFDLRQTLFDKLPSFFAPRQYDPQV